MAITQRKLDEMRMKSQVYADGLSRAQQESFLASRHPDNLPETPTRSVDTSPQPDQEDTEHTDIGGR